MRGAMAAHQHTHRTETLDDNDGQLVILVIVCLLDTVHDSCSNIFAYGLLGDQDDCICYTLFPLSRYVLQ